MTMSPGISPPEALWLQLAQGCWCLESDTAASDLDIDRDQRAVRLPGVS